MLLRLILAPQVPNYSIPINVNTQVRHLIRLATRTFHRHCDEKIIRERRWQSFDTYTFSQLHIPNRKINENRIMGGEEPTTLYISSPDIQFIKCLDKVFKEWEVIQIQTTRFTLVRTEFEETPELEEVPHFTCLSPAAITRPQKSKAFMFILPMDYDMNHYLTQAMHRRYEAYYGETLEKPFLKVEFDPDYVLRKKSKITKLINIHKYEDLGFLKVKSFFSPLVLRGTPELVRFAYEAGLGEFTDYGFGMLQHVVPDKYVKGRRITT
ncbi:CRISPR-associated endoribonuclease Cas6 [Fidelibacter multiformis]|uniref:CRISPR-associated endoribonuclease Cas6 n=1 Tax=Fidelibacter multiformis TaxID=3377529 RepID=UPI0037DDB436